MHNYLNLGMRREGHCATAVGGPSGEVAIFPEVANFGTSGDGGGGRQSSPFFGGPTGK